VSLFADLVAEELERARRKHPSMPTLHHGHSVLLEELNEFWDEVKKQAPHQDLEAAVRELVQIAASAQRIAEEVLHVGPVDSPFVGTGSGS